MQFDDDPCAIKDYTKKRLSNSDLETIINCTILTIDTTSYCTKSSHVENSFSLLSKLLKKDKNCDVNNVKKYMVLYYNKKSMALVITYDKGIFIFHAPFCTLFAPPSLRTTVLWSCIARTKFRSDIAVSAFWASSTLRNLPLLMITFLLYVFELWTLATAGVER